MIIFHINKNVVEIEDTIMETVTGPYDYNWLIETADYYLKKKIPFKVAVKQRITDYYFITDDSIWQLINGTASEEEARKMLSEYGDSCKIIKIKG